MIAPDTRADDLELALLAARDKEKRLKAALVEAAIPLEVLAAQIQRKPFQELCHALQLSIVVATIKIRAALD